MVRRPVDLDKGLDLRVRVDGLKHVEDGGQAGFVAAEEMPVRCWIDDGAATWSPRQHRVAVSRTFGPDRRWRISMQHEIHGKLPSRPVERADGVVAAAGAAFRQRHRQSGYDIRPNIDVAACAAGLHAEAGEAQRYAVTLALTTNFTKPANKGYLSFEGRVITASYKTYTAEAQVRDDSGDIVAHGVGTFQWRPGSAPSARTDKQATPEAK